MKWKDLFEKWDMQALKIHIPFLEMDWRPEDADKDAAWEMYIELKTRVLTQELAPDRGDEETALESVYFLFGITREVLKKYERGCKEFAKIALVVLNQVVRPFTAKWHKLKMEGAFKDEKVCQEFRDELSLLQRTLKHYTKMLAVMAGVGELIDIENKYSTCQ
jgi:hypothetical protein